MWKGLGSLVKKNDVTWIAGRGRLEGATKVRVQPGRRGRHARARAASASSTAPTWSSRRARGSSPCPGIVPDGEADRDLGRRAHARTRCPASVIVIGAGAVGVEFASMYHDLGAKVTLLEYLPAIVPLEDAEVSKELERSFNRRGIKVITNARFDAASVIAERRRRPDHRGPRGREAAEIAAEMLLVAAGRATNVEDVGPRDHVGRGGPGHRQGRRPHAHRGAAPVRDRRHRRRAPARAHGRARGDHRGPHDRRRPGRPRHGLREAAARPRTAAPRSRPSGLTQQQCEERGLPIKVGKVPFQAIGKAIIGGEYEGFTQDHRRQARPTRRSASTSSARTPPTSSRRARSRSGLEATPWEIGATTHAHPTLSEILGETAMAVDGRAINF